MSPRRVVAADTVPAAVYTLCVGGWQSLAVGMAGIEHLSIEAALDDTAGRQWWAQWRERVLAEAARRSAPRPLWVEVEDEQ